MIDSRMLRRAKFHPMTLTMMVSYPAILSLIPPFLYFESSSFLETFKAGNHKHDIEIVLIMNWIAFAYLFSGTLLLSLTSAHFSQVIASFKVVLLVGVATQVFHTVFTTINFYGLFVTFLAFCTYSYLRYIGAEEVKKIDIKNSNNHINNINNNDNDNDDIIYLMEGENGLEVEMDVIGEDGEISNGDNNNNNNNIDFHNRI